MFEMIIYSTVIVFEFSIIDNVFNIDQTYPTGDIVIIIINNTSDG